MRSVHNIGDIIRGEYRITGLLGQGGMGTTYSAESIRRFQKVAIKVITLKHIENFKTLELFEREAKTLSQLDHSNIPKYIDYFQIDRPRQRFFYIIQQLAEGENFANLIKKGWNPNESEVKQIAESLLDTLIYLQQIIPPVIHRDIKPQNIIYNQFLNFQDKDKLFLVDFGAVQDAYHNSLTGGSTIVGTYGYMAPEQFRGQAKLSTDLYGLGATLIFLLTHQHPSELPQKKLKIDWRSLVKIDKNFGNWLDRIIEPVVEDRFRSAEEALAVLRGEAPYTSYTNQKNSRPITSRVSVIDHENKKIIFIPPIFFHSKYSRFLLPIPTICSIFLLFYLWIAFATFIQKGSFIDNFNGVIFFLAITLIVVLIVYRFIIEVASEINIKIDTNSISFRQTIFGLQIQSTKIKGDIGKILQAKLKNTLLSLRKGSKITVCNLTIKRRNIRFASFLSEEEKQWLIEEIQDFLERQKLKLEEE